MIAYLLKFILCSSLFYLIYHLLLEKESMHRFKRFYLLFTLVASFVIPVTPSILSYALKPAATIHQSVDQKITEFGSWIVPQEYTDVTYIAYQPQEATSNPLAAIMIVFGFISFLLLVRYLINIARIKRSGQKHQIPKKYDQANLALIKNLPASYSFWNTIFLNKNNYETNEIDPKILTHELIHVKQKHTADVLFIEWLLTFFWFNPALYLYRRAIKLNHEFLADEGVVQQTNQVFEYQTILLNQASGNSHAFASSFNYLITKKRLIMMTKKTSAKKILLSMLFVIPFSIFIACSLGKTKPEAAEETAEEPVEQTQEKVIEETREASASEMEEYYNKETSGERRTEIAAKMSDEQKESLPPPPKKATLKFVPPVIKKEGTNVPPPPPPPPLPSERTGATKSEMEEYNKLWTNFKNSDLYAKGLIEKEDITPEIERLLAIYNIMSEAQQKEVEAPPLRRTIRFVPPKIKEEGKSVSEAEMKDYKRNLEKYADTQQFDPTDKNVISELNKYRNLYDKMSDEQQRDVKYAIVTTQYSIQQTKNKMGDGASETDIQQYEQLVEKYREIGKINISSGEEADSDFTTLRNIYKKMNKQQEEASTNPPLIVSFSYYSKAPTSPK